MEAARGWPQAQGCRADEPILERSRAGKGIRELDLRLAAVKVEPEIARITG